MHSCSDCLYLMLRLNGIAVFHDNGVPVHGTSGLTELFECENYMNHISFAVPRSYPTLAPMASFEPLSSGLNSLLLKSKIS